MWGLWSQFCKLVLFDIVISSQNVNIPNVNQTGPWEVDVDQAGRSLSAAMPGCTHCTRAGGGEEGRRADRDACRRRAAQPANRADHPRLARLVPKTKKF